MDNNLRTFLIRELNSLEEQCDALLATRAPITAKLIREQNQNAVDNCFAPNTSSRELRRCIRTMRQVLEKGAK